MKNLNEHISRMRQLFGAEHGIIKPLVSEQDEFDDMITKNSPSSKPLGDTKSQNNNQSKPNPNYKNSNDSFEDKDDMVNKPGSGKNIIAVVDAVVKNNTKGTEEVVKLSLDEDTYGSDYMGRSDLGPSTLKMLEDYGYYLVGILDKKKYSDGDSFVITATIPFRLGNSKIERDCSKDSINYAEKSASGNNKTTIKLTGSIVGNPRYPENYCNLYVVYEIDESSPFADFKKATIDLRFK